MPNAIVVSADRDLVTQALSVYALKIATIPHAASTTHAHNQAANHIRSIITLGAGEHVFFFLHGQDNPVAIFDGYGNPVIDQTTINLLSSRTVCGTCHSANNFATLATQHGARVVGYNGRMLVPLDQRYVQAMAEAVIAAHIDVLNGKDVSVAAENARKEYQKIAHRWFGNGSIKGQVYGALAQANADAIRSRS